MPLMTEKFEVAAEVVANAAALFLSNANKDRRDGLDVWVGLDTVVSVGRKVARAQCRP